MHDPADELLLLCALCFDFRQLYAQEAACRLQAAERDEKSLQRLSKQEYVKMMLPDSPPGGGRGQKVRPPTSLTISWRGVSANATC